MSQGQMKGLILDPTAVAGQIGCHRVSGQSVCISLNFYLRLETWKEGLLELKNYENNGM